MAQIGTSQPGFVLAATGDNIAQGVYLVSLPYDVSKATPRKWVLCADGFIRHHANTNLVLNVNGVKAMEGQRVLLWYPKTSDNANQRWKQVGAEFISELEGGFRLGVNKSNQIIITNTSSTFEYPYVHSVELNQGESYTPNKEFSQFTATVIVSPTGPQGRILDKITPGGNDGWLLDIYSYGHLRAYASPRIINSGTVLTMNTPTHLAITFDGKELILYVNGEKTDSLSSPALLTQNKHPIRVGCDADGGNSFPGTIKRAHLHFQTFTAAEIKADYLSYIMDCNPT